MAINDIVQYNIINSGFLPLHFTVHPSPYILEWFDDDNTIIDIISVILLTMYYNNHYYSDFSLNNTIIVVMFGYDWWLCMVINVISVQYNGTVGFSPTLCC